MAITSANQLELLQTAEAVAREKDDRPCIWWSKRWKNRSPVRPKVRYGAEMDIRVCRSTARPDARAFTRVRTVVADEEVENYQAEMTVEQARALS